MFIFPSFSVFVVRVGFCSSSIPSQNFLWTVALIARIIPNCIFFFLQLFFSGFVVVWCPKGVREQFFCFFLSLGGLVVSGCAVGGVVSFQGGAICDQEAYDSEGERKT
jgi:hypothetical protein